MTRDEWPNVTKNCKHLRAFVDNRVSESLSRYDTEQESRTGSELHVSLLKVQGKFTRVSTWIPEDNLCTPQAVHTTGISRKHPERLHGVFTDWSATSHIRVGLDVHQDPALHSFTHFLPLKIADQTAVSIADVTTDLHCGSPAGSSTAVRSGEWRLSIAHGKVRRDRTQVRHYRCGFVVLD